MNRNVLSRIAMMLIAAVAMAACSRHDSADLSEILATVPSDASMVVTFDSKNLAEKAGCKVSGDKIEPSAELDAAINSYPDSTKRRDIRLIFSGESGIALTSVVVFSQGYYTYVTGMLADPEAFKAFAVKDSGSGAAFAEKEGVAFCRRYAVVGNRFWLLTDGPDIDPMTVKGFNTLSEQQSYLSKDYAETLLKMEHDIDAVADLNAPLLSPQDFKQRLQTQTILQTLFKDPAFIAGSVDFLDGELKATAAMLDNKLRLAEFNFPVSKISADAVKKLSGSGEVAVAVALSQKFSEKIISMVGSLGYIGKMASDLLGPVDGTIAMIFSNADNHEVSGIIETEGKDLNPLTQFIDGIGLKWKLDGKNILISGNPVTGSISPESFASECKGAAAAFEISGKYAAEKGFAQGGSISGRLIPEGKSLRMRLGVKTTTPKENVLVTIIKSHTALK